MFKVQPELPVRSATTGAAGIDGLNGTVTPLAASGGVIALPTGSAPIAVVTLQVPAGSYIVLAKSQVSQTGAGDAVTCTLNVAGAEVDEDTMKTMPALAAIPMSLQAVIAPTSTSTVNVTCSVMVANGAANFSSLIAIPTS